VAFFQFWFDVGTKEKSGNPETVAKLVLIS
jgi:hypothetical protein